MRKLIFRPSKKTKMIHVLKKTNRHESIIYDIIISVKVVKPKEGSGLIGMVSRWHSGTSWHTTSTCQVPKKGILTGSLTRLVLD